MKLNINDSSVLFRINIKDKENLITYCISNNIYFSTKEERGNKAFFVIKYYDYKVIKKKFKTKISTYYGKKKIYKIIKQEWLAIVCLFFSFILILYLSSMCFGINIYTDDENLKKEIYKVLSENDIEKYKLKKSYDKRETVKQIIYDKFNDNIQWIEIKQRGVFYDVFITKKIKNIEKEECAPQHVVASKDGLVLSIIKEEGVVLKYINDYVKKGEVLISGEIYNNSKLKGLVCAQGKVYAEVWYTSTVTVPFKYVEYVSTGKKVNHYYLDFGSFDLTLLGYYKSDMTFSNKKILVDKFYLPFKLIKEEKEIYEYKTFNLSEDDAYNEAIERSDKSINNKLSEEEYIIDKKVLKKEVFSSKIVIEVFYKVYEDITDTKLIGENNDGISN